MIARPSLVAMRARKPWRRARTSWDGWYVRFITSNRAWHGSSSLVLQQQEFRTPNKRHAPAVRVGGVYRENSSPSQRAPHDFLASVAPLFSGRYRPIKP